MIGRKLLHCKIVEKLGEGDIAQAEADVAPAESK